MTITRRGFLKTGAMAMAVFGLGGTPNFLARTARASTLQGQGKKKVLVAIFQRGAMDGLMAVAPFADPAMRTMRPRLGMDAASTAGNTALIDLDGRFGLHPGFADLAPFFRSGQLAIVHGVGSPNPTRSHFDAQDYMETGTPGVKGTQSGWLNRVSGLLGHDRTPFCSCSMTPVLPRSFYGNEPALSIVNLADFAINVRPTNVVAQSAGQMLESLYDETPQRLLRDTGRESFDAAKALSKTQAVKYVPSNGAVYPNGPLGNSLKQVSQIIKADLGLEIAFVESVGWDTHVAQGTVNGTFAQRAKELTGTIAAFWTDLGSAANDIVLMTMTEFGRTVHENGTGGTDHGRGSCMFVLGSEVAGGKVYGTVPALAKENLEDGRDLPVTTDFRSVFSAVAGRHFYIEDDATMFPGWTGNRIGIMRG